MNEIEARVMRAVSRPGGASAREIRDCLNGPERKILRVARDAMLRARQIFSATHRFPGAQRASTRYFGTQASADLWPLQSAAKTARAPLAKPQAKAPPRGKTLRFDAPVAPHDIKPHGPPAGYDYRYTVRKLPAGYVSVLNSAECSPWAISATARTC